MLVDSYTPTIKLYPNLNDPNAFSELAQAILTRVDERKIHQDEFYAHCSRLAGFAFAIVTVRNVSRMSPADYCFRPTRRGIRLLEMISSANETIAKIERPIEASLTHVRHGQRQGELTIESLPLRGQSSDRVGRVRTRVERFSYAARTNFRLC
jgi:hypothetical protein